ncbi:MAG TPA: hypothetical protein VM599_04700 [Thermoanaerobaculia bacterium]|jgi:hypothetical protein|nr:hypothetical protein [Thermoanaerobaculia bacterium]
MSDRKYRQSGYQDSDRGADRPRPGKQPPREKREGPWGRGLGAPTASVFRCSACGGKVEILGELDLDAKCPHCKADLHTCTNCTNFDPSAPWECREHQNIPQKVTRKAKANECPLFNPKVAKEFATEGEGGPTVGDAKKAFDALFGDL